MSSRRRLPALPSSNNGADAITGATDGATAQRTPAGELDNRRWSDCSGHNDEAPWSSVPCTELRCSLQ